MIGALDQRVTVQARSDLTSVDAEGQPSAVWVDQRTVWAAVDMMTGREERTFSRIVGTVARVFTMRYRSDISVLNQITWGGSTWNIHDIQRHPREPFMKLFCSEVE